MRIKHNSQINHNKPLSLVKSRLFCCVLREWRTVALLYLMRIAFIIVLGFYKKNRGGVSMNKDWWKAAGIRALRTFAQTAAATIGAGAISPIHEIDWIYCLSIAATAAILSLLTSLAGLPEVEDDRKI